MYVVYSLVKALLGDLDGLIGDRADFVLEISDVVRRDLDVNVRQLATSEVPDDDSQSVSASSLVFPRVRLVIRVAADAAQSSVLVPLDLNN